MFRKSFKVEFSIIHNLINLCSHVPQIDQARAFHVPQIDPIWNFHSPNISKNLSFSCIKLYFMFHICSKSRFSCSTNLIGIFNVLKIYQIWVFSLSLLWVCMFHKVKKVTSFMFLKLIKFEIFMFDNLIWDFHVYQLEYVWVFRVLQIDIVWFFLVSHIDQNRVFHVPQFIYFWVLN